MFFDTHINLRIRGKEAKEIADFLDKHQDDFDSVSDVVRAGLMQFIRNYKLETLTPKDIEEEVKSNELR